MLVTVLKRSETLISNDDDDGDGGGSGSEVMYMSYADRLLLFTNILCLILFTH